MCAPLWCKSLSSTALTMPDWPASAPRVRLGSYFDAQGLVRGQACTRARLGCAWVSSTTEMPDAGGSSRRQACERTIGENSAHPPRTNTWSPSRRCSTTLSVRNTLAARPRMWSARTRANNQHAHQFHPASRAPGRTSLMQCPFSGTPHSPLSPAPSGGPSHRVCNQLSIPLQGQAQHRGSMGRQ